MALINYDSNMKQILRLFTCCIFVFFGLIVSAQTSTDLENSSVKLQTNKQNSVKNIKLIRDSKVDTLSKVKQQSTSTSQYTNAVEQSQLRSESNKKSIKIKMISPTSVVPNTTKRKDIKQRKSKYQRKKIKTNKGKDE
jgi:hypothetical protein